MQRAEASQYNSITYETIKKVAEMREREEKKTCFNTVCFLPVLSRHCSRLAQVIAPAKYAP